MSRRFGRNQRRKLRADLASAIAAASHAKREKEEHARARLALEGELIDWAARIVALLGPESAFARVMAEHNIDHALFDDVAINGQPFFVEPYQPLAAPGPEPLADVAASVIGLFATYAVPENERYRWRFIIRRRDGEAALIADERTIYQLRRRGDRELVRFITSQLVKPWLEGGRKMTYRREIPRDLFNEASLLKCLGRLWIETEQFIPRVRIIHTGNDFHIAQDEADGSIRCGNVCLIINGRTYDHRRPLNARDSWPLYIWPRADPDAEEIEVFTDDGSLSVAMLLAINGRSVDV